MIAALYVETGGCYFGLPGVDPWDEARDARKYAGPWPVVAHPPCQRWGKLWAGQPLFIKKTGIRKIKGDDNGCFAAALAAVREHGGVIEHPWGSHAWAHFGLAKPPRTGGWIKADDFGGWTCCVEQGRYGHYARKPTLLYVVGTDRPELEWGESAPRLDPEVVKRMGLKRAKRLGEVGAKGGGKDSSPRIGTPKPFRDLLLEIASSAENVETYVNKLSTERDKSVNNATTSKETSKVTIKIEIIGEDAQAVATQLLVLGSLITQKIGGRTEEQKAELEILEPKKAAPKKAAAKKPETIEHEPKPDSETEQEAPAANAEVDPEPAEDVEAEKPMSIDELRQYTISKYLAEVFPKREDQKDAFKALLDKFKIEKLGDLLEDKAVAFKAEVDARIADAGKK